MEVKHWWVNKTTGSTSNLGDNVEAPARYINDVLDVIQGYTAVTSGMPSGISILKDRNWIPPFGAISPSYLLNWQLDGLGHIDFWISVPNADFYLGEFPGPKVRLDEDSGTHEITLYDGFLKKNDSRFQPFFELKFNIDTNDSTFDSSGSTYINTDIVYPPEHQERYRSIRHCIHLSGGIYDEEIIVWGNIILEGQGASFGQPAIHYLFGSQNPESTIAGSSILNRRPLIVLIGGSLSLDGVNSGMLWALSGSFKLKNPVSTGETIISLNSLEGVYASFALGIPLRIGSFRDLPELVFVDSSATPKAYGFQVIDFTTDYVIFSGLDVLNNFAPSGTLSSQAIGGQLVFEWPYSSIEDDGSGNSKVNFTTPLDPSLVDRLSVIGYGEYFLCCEKIVLTSPVQNDWPVDTPVTYHTPPAMAQLLGAQNEYRRCTLSSSSAGLIFFPLPAMTIIAQIMSGLWETKFSDRCTFLTAGNGSCAIAKYPFIEQRVTVSESYLLCIGKSHCYGAMDWEYVPWIGSPIIYKKPSMTKFDMIERSTIDYLVDGDLSDIVGLHPDIENVFVWFRRNAYTKPLIRIPDYFKMLMLGTLTENTIDYVYYPERNVYPVGTVNKDPFPMSHPDEFRADVTGVGVFPSKEM